MALFYTPPKTTKKSPHLIAEIVDLDYQGLGVAKIQGKTWFVENALPTEKSLNSCHGRKMPIRIRHNTKKWG